MGLRAPPNLGEGQGLYVRVMLAADGSLFLPSSWPVPNTSSQGARFWNLGAIDAQSVTSDLLPTRTRGHCHGLPHRALGGRPLAAKVHCPLMCPPRKLPPRGLGGTSNICKLIGLSPAPPVSLCPQAGSAPHPTPACTLCCGCPMGRACGCPWRAGAGGSGRTRPAPACPLAWTLLSLYLCILCNET